MAAASSHQPEPPFTVRAVRPADDEPLGRLMERAYAGTIDEDLGDNDDGLLARLRLPSFVVVDDVDQPVSASLVSAWEDGAVIVSYVITDPRHKRQGLGAAAVAASLGCLDPGRAVFAGVTNGNEPSSGC